MKKILFIFLFFGMTQDCFSFPKYKCVIVIGNFFYSDIESSSSIQELEIGDYFDTAEGLLFSTQRDTIFAADSSGALFLFYYLPKQQLNSLTPDNSKFVFDHKMKPQVIAVKVKGGTRKEIQKYFYSNQTEMGLNALTQLNLEQHLQLENTIDVNPINQYKNINQQLERQYQELKIDYSNNQEQLKRLKGNFKLQSNYLQESLYLEHSLEFDLSKKDMRSIKKEIKKINKKIRKME